MNRYPPHKPPPIEDAPGLDAPATRNEYTQAFYEHWLAQRDEAIVPTGAAIDPTAILDLLPWVHLLERSPDGSFVWRLMGSKLVALFNIDLTGQIFDPTAFACDDQRFLMVYAAVIGQPCGAVIRCRAHTNDAGFAPLDILALPLQKDDGCTTEVITHSQIPDREHLQFQRSSFLIQLRIERFDFFDIGAGKPLLDFHLRTSVEKKER